MNNLLLLIFSIVPYEYDMVTDKVDLVEINHFYNNEGEWKFDQIIWYDWYPERCRFEVRDFRMMKDTERGRRPKDKEEEQKWDEAQKKLAEHRRMPFVPEYLADSRYTPKKDHAKNDYYSTFIEGGNYIRRVRAKSFRESWTQYDVESEERAVIQQEDRRGLSEPHKNN